MGFLSGILDWLFARAEAIKALVAIVGAIIGALDILRRLRRRSRQPQAERPSPQPDKAMESHSPQVTAGHSLLKRETDFQSIIIFTKDFGSCRVRAGSGEYFKDATYSPQLVIVPPGYYTMGAPTSEYLSADSERPTRRVHIPQAFAIGRFPVTRKEWMHFATDSGERGYFPLNRGWGDDLYPVVDVSFDDALSYIEWLAKKTGRAYRLPSEAEWEYSARAGTTTAYWWGDRIDPSRANYNAQVSYNGSHVGNYLARTSKCDCFSANDWGLHDAHGNVWEWVQDCWHDTYQNAPSSSNPWEVERGGNPRFRVLRGGSWSDPPQWLRSAARNDADRSTRNDNKGFRVIREL
ncbi:formylglycine-generating enzyme family protein [Rhodomicrobium sp. Az07]|uniref:formylglycine-generating enzyme family protein n=1 Tax=Rhodomicrobium sp. Az07 TaxID=2839034 RepID=UPI001BECA502|nr:formylglycine-generating enzyme family protein [Rhodomicrobium sp. Az07]MBT3072041.1 formylglycine-generating enzyme family protein [Rhodomicrobium sp. Az07]